VLRKGPGRTMCEQSFMVMSCTLHQLRHVGFSPTSRELLLVCFSRHPEMWKSQKHKACLETTFFTWSLSSPWLSCHLQTDSNLLHSKLLICSPDPSVQTPYLLFPQTCLTGISNPMCPKPNSWTEWRKSLSLCYLFLHVSLTSPNSYTTKPKSAHFAPPF
jgi:hypothetical protein